MSKPAKHLFLFAGEKSGDLHGGRLLKNLQNDMPTAIFSGVCGPEMRKHKIDSILPMEDFEVMGFSDVLFSLPKLLKRYYVVRDHILKKKPQTVILIDYPGFNLRLAKGLRKHGYQGKIVQYISPTVWAHGKERIHTLASHYNLLLTIYPFEEKYYHDTPLKVRFVGNPLQEYLAEHIYQDNWKQDLQIPENIPIISLFPGSRQSEIFRNLPIQLQALEMWFSKNSDRIAAISCSTSQYQKIVEDLLAKTSLKKNKNIFLVPAKYNYELMRDSRTAIAKSGTVTLELALHERPSIITYNASTLNRFIGKYFLKLSLPYFCIVNILAEKEVFPELIRKQPTAEELLNLLETFDCDSTNRENCLADCKNISQMLSIKDASRQAAKAIRELLP